MKSFELEVCDFCGQRFNSATEEEYLVKPPATKNVCPTCYSEAVCRLQDAGKKPISITDQRIVDYLEYGFFIPDAMSALEDR